MAQELRALEPVTVRGRPGGFAVPVVLLLLLALTALGHGALEVARAEAAASAAARRLLQREAAARGALLRWLAGADSLPDALPGTAVGVAGGVAGRVRWSVALRRLSAETALLEATGRPDSPLPGGTAPTWTTGLALWALEPAERARSASAAVESGGPVIAPPGSVRGGPGVPGSCPGRPGLARGAGAATAALPPGPPPPAGVASGGPPGLGLLSGRTVLDRLPARPEGVATPGPVDIGGACRVAEPWNLGSPTRPGGPCGAHRPAVAVRGDLVLRGGEGQGLLVVDGDLTLEAGAHYRGLVLVAGELTVRGGAVLVGLARVGGAVRVAGGQIEGNRCAAADALEASPGLRGPRPVRGAWILPL